MLNKISIENAVKAYLFGYPLVLMDVTREVQTDPQSGRALVNQFFHNQLFPDHTYREVVRVNNDTLYSNAWIDLSSEPLVLSVPYMSDRYYVMPFMDAWTNVFAMIGKRTVGSGPGDFMLAGPDWNGENPAEVKVIQAPTNMCWLIGRIQVNGQSDALNVGELQQQLKLTPLSRWESRTANPGSRENRKDPKGVSADPMAIVEKMSAGVFFARLSRLMGEQPAAAADVPMLDLLRAFGIESGKPFNIDKPAIDLLEEGVTEACRMLQALSEAGGKGQRFDNNWGLSRAGMGVYGTNYRKRAFVALVGLGALPAEEAAYATARKDQDDRMLNGSQCYRIHFDADNMPPEDAFWSLTLYDKKGFLADNPIRRYTVGMYRYTVGDRNTLVYNEDGSLDIFIQHDRPARGESNWLPSCEGLFELTLRLYMPKASFLDGTWKPPFVERIKDE
ncbi:MAG: DUF1254 domain-containing protein [Deltaproteobacteria bacterium]|nr:DUF1254 domain-containing protein [Deltaproteobacteria bacterium]